MFCVLLAPVCCYCNCSCVPIVLAVRIILVVLVFLVKRCPDQFPVAQLFLFCITLNLLMRSIVIAMPPKRKAAAIQFVKAMPPKRKAGEKLLCYCNGCGSEF